METKISRFWSLVIFLCSYFMTMRWGILHGLIKRHRAWKRYKIIINLLHFSHPLLVELEFCIYLLTKQSERKHKMFWTFMHVLFDYLRRRHSCYIHLKQRGQREKHSAPTTVPRTFLPFQPIKTAALSFKSAFFSSHQLTELECSLALCTVFSNQS